MICVFQLTFFVDTLRFSLAEPQLQILSPLAKTQYYYDNVNAMYFDGHPRNMSYWGACPDSVDCEMIRGNRHVFPNFYSIPTQFGNDYIRDLHDFLTSCSRSLRWLLISMRLRYGSVLDIFDEWRDCKARRDQINDGVIHHNNYYQTSNFVDDLFEFIRQH